MWLLIYGGMVGVGAVGTGIAAAWHYRHDMLDAARRLGEQRRHDRATRTPGALIGYEHAQVSSLHGVRWERRERYAVNGVELDQFLRTQALTDAVRNVQIFLDDLDDLDSGSPAPRRPRRWRR